MVTFFLTLHALSDYPCVEFTDEMKLSISAVALGTAGPDATICEGITYTLSAASASNYLSLNWTTSGTGAFDKHHRFIRFIIQVLLT